MAIQSERNLYPGINAHLNSRLQNESGRWRSYHSYHITDLARLIDEWLPPGYRSIAEQSLQGTEVELHYFPPGLRLIPDVTIYRDSATRQRSPQAIPEAAKPTAVVSTEYLIEEDEDTLTGIIIYQLGEGDGVGRPITRIELLSPANKPGGSVYQQYRAKRLDVLKSGLRMVEIDYLHQTPPIHPALRNYARGEADAYPYAILVTDPRPSLESGTTAIYTIAVNQALPVIDIPLAGVDTARIDFGAIYNRTFESTYYLQDLVDYAEDPVHFDRYSPADQAKIRALLEEIRRTHQNTP